MQPNAEKFTSPPPTLSSLFSPPIPSYPNKASSIAFIVGIALYVLDGLLLLALGVFLSAGFHAFALIFIIRGFLACRELNALDAARAIQTPPPPPPMMG